MIKLGILEKLQFLIFVGGNIRKPAEIKFNIYKMKAIFKLILMTFFLTSCQAQNADLALNLEKGKEYKQITNSKMTILQEVNGQEMKMVMTINGTMTFFVNDIIENSYDMDVKFEKLSMSMQMPQGSMEFNSEKNDENDVFSTILGAMKDQKFSLTMSKAGKVTDVKNVDALWSKAINQFDQLPEMQKEQIKAQIMKAYGPDALKGNIEMVTAIYPDSPANKGDKWTINTKLESGMSANVITDYEFAKLTSDYALIKGKSTITTADKDAYIESNGMPMKYDLTGSMESEIKVDKYTGWILEGKINQKMEGVTYIKENPQMPTGMEIPMDMTNEMVITDK
jgi:hypothetical protein